MYKRLESATAKLLRLTPEPRRGQRQFLELAALQEAVAAILSHHQVTDFLHVTYHEQVAERSIRGYGGRPARVETTVRYQVEVTRNETAIQDASRQMGSL